MEKEDIKVALRYKIDVMAELKNEWLYFHKNKRRKTDWTIVSSTDKTQ